MALFGAIVIAAAGVVAWSGVIGRPVEPHWQFKVSTGDYADRATRSVRLLEHTFYNGTGLWHMCVPAGCFTKNRDWGADSLTYVLYLRWMLTRDPSIPPIMRTLAQTAHSWGPADTGSSDTVMWDAIADAREYEVTRARAALTKAEAAFRWVDSVKAAGFASGACPAIDYQWPSGRGGDLKTLETASNYIKAALLLYRSTGQRDYLAKAEREYTQVRHYFLTSSVPLYTVYVFDNGTTCRALPGHFFASVNGNMIWAGQALARATGHRGYLTQAIATARAVRSRLSDGAGIFADLQADNDVAEPLIEAIYVLATAGHQAFAASWLAPRRPARTPTPPAWPGGSSTDRRPPRWLVPGRSTAGSPWRRWPPRSTRTGGPPIRVSGGMRPTSPTGRAWKAPRCASPSRAGPSRSWELSERAAAGPGMPGSSPTGPRPTIAPACGRT